MAEQVPEVTEIEAVYGLDGVAKATERLQRVAKAFQDAYGAPPDVFARAPGRVNLIGEHIDYEGYGVLPMAIANDTVVAVRRTADARLAVANVNAAEYPAASFSTDPSQAVDTANHSWANYFLAAYKGVFEHLGAAAPAPAGLQVMVHGTVPLGSGLSSSAAIVVASSLAVLAAHNLRASKAAVAEFTCTAERHVGVTSGGMDQAISVMGMPGVAMLVEFDPVRGTDVKLPAGATFVIANSLAVSKKAETAAKRYNLRVVECRLAAALLALGLGAGAADAAAVRTLKEVEPAIAASPHGAGAAGQAAAAEALLHEAPYTQAEVEAALGAPMSTLFAGDASALRSLAAVAADGDGLKLRQRALHVYSEAARVHAFKAAAEAGRGDEGLAALGALMDASHESCARLYECSCPELDELVSAAKAAGALGARLTGAGWGGCTVSLVREADVPKFVAALRESYYARRVADGLVAADGLGDVLFASRPSSGAAMLRVKLSGLSSGSAGDGSAKAGSAAGSAAAPMRSPFADAQPPPRRRFCCF